MQYYISLLGLRALVKAEQICLRPAKYPSSAPQAPGPVMNIYESSCVLDSPDTLFPIRVHGPLAIGIVLSKKTKQTFYFYFLRPIFL